MTGDFPGANVAGPTNHVLRELEGSIASSNAPPISTYHERQEEERQRFYKCRQLALSRVRGSQQELIILGCSFIILACLQCSTVALGAVYDLFASPESPRLMGLIVLEFLAMMHLAIVAYAREQMKTLESYRWAMIGSFFALLPCSPIWLVRFPLGI